VKRRPDGETPPKPVRRTRRGLTPEERTLWAHVVQSAKPMPGRSLPAPEPLPEPEAQPDPSSPRLPAAAPPARPRLLPLAGVERRMLKDLSRGSRQVEGRLDLHGMRQAEAHQALRAFLHRHHALGSKLLLVITGKGGGPDSMTGERGILRRLVPHWLADPDLRPLVVGFEVSARQHGGEGALYVRLRRRRDT
jgi:DNA-nicking Smr family endonuclease